MTNSRVWLLGLGLAILTAACSSSQGGNSSTGGSPGNTGGNTGNTCSATQTLCGSNCVDTTSDPANCGGCGSPCDNGQTCQNSQCQCPSGQSCGGSTGGTTGSGGSVSTGGTTGSGGSTGGSHGTGGSGNGTGGTPGSGGSTGGTTGTGGSVGTGGSAPGTGGTAPAQPLVITSYGATGASTYWQTGSLATSTAGATVTVNDSSTMQTWEGFGGALNEMGWNYLLDLSASDQAKALDLLFGTDAAHFGIARIPVGASDYALQRYTDDETSGDTSLSSFSITQDQKYLIPYAKAALKVNPSLRFWASPWTPPTWMKTFSGSNSNGTSCAKVGSTNFDGGCMNATSANLTALATYLSKWVTAYGGQGITIDTIAPQNEPNYAQGYPSCLWNTADYVTFFKGPLATAFPSSGSTKIMLGTMSNGDNGATSFDLKVVQAVEADSAAKAIPKVMGLQWGMLDLYEGLSSGVGQSNFMTSGLPVWATEHKCGNYPWNPTGTNSGTGLPFAKYVEPAPNDQAYGVESWDYIRNAITKAGVTAYNAWNMVLDTVGKGNDTTRQWAQDALLTVNTSSKALIVTPAYYVFRHCAQYVQVGAKVVTTSGGDAIAFKNPDGSEVAVMYNSGSASTYVIQIKGQKLSFSMPSNGWATVVAP
jgi:glucosylceramidase